MPRFKLQGNPFLLLSLPGATLERGNDVPVADPSYLECVTISVAQSPFPDRGVHLVVKLGCFEIPVDPRRRVGTSVGHHLGEGKERGHGYTNHLIPDLAHFRC